MTHFDTEAEIDAIEAAARLDDDLNPDCTVPSPPTGQRSQVYSVRIPVDRIEQLRLLAQARGTQPTAMIRDWVLARLDAELQSPAPSRIEARRVAGGVIVRASHDHTREIKVTVEEWTAFLAAVKRGDLDHLAEVQPR